MKQDKTPENIAWKGDEPTEVVKKAVDEGIIKPGDRVLDIGCGFGRNANGIAKMGTDVTAVNIDDDEIDYAKIRADEAGVCVDYIHANATELPFPEKSFDVALDLGCSHMISTKEGQENAAREASRVLKPGGFLVYFGFSKEHPSYKNKPESVMFRNIEDVKDMYGNDFEIVSKEEIRWKPSKEENANVEEHIGINVIMNRKSNY